MRSPPRSALRDAIRCIPFLIIIASVMGFILTGVATPSESAATGVLGALLTAPDIPEAQLENGFGTALGSPRTSPA